MIVRSTYPQWNSSSSMSINSKSFDHASYLLSSTIIVVLLASKKEKRWALVFAYVHIYTHVVDGEKWMEGDWRKTKRRGSYTTERNMSTLLYVYMHQRWQRFKMIDWLIFMWWFAYMWDLFKLLIKNKLYHWSTPHKVSPIWHCSKTSYKYKTWYFYRMHIWNPFKVLYKRIP